MEDNLEVDQLLKAVRKKYRRASEKRISIKKLKDKKLKTKLGRHEKLIEDAADRAAKVELLLTGSQGYIEVEEMEKTWKITQDQLVNHVDQNTQSNIFSLDLDVFGPYSIDYTRDGRCLLLGGIKGHVASFDWKTKKLYSEFHVKETVRDVKWLHNETMYAVAQKKYTYIYDKTGMELHCLRNHVEANFLEYLPYHWLLASVGTPGKLAYQDISTGEIVSILNTRQGPASSMTQNKYNSILHLGHSNGVIALWSPSVSTPLVKMLCHKGPVLGAGVDISGKYMATAGTDKQLKLWDLRNYKLLNAYALPRPATNISISDMGVICAAGGSRAYTWKQAFTSPQNDPYLTHLVPGSTIKDVQFVPFEDALGLGHEKGFSSIVVPGSGNPNFDSIELNPFRTKRQRQESEIHGLLEKLSPDMIVLDPTSIATFNPKREETSMKHPLELREEIKDINVKNKTRKKSSFKRLLKKKSNIIDKKLTEIRRIKNVRLNDKEKVSVEPSLDSEAIDVLDRFKKKT